MLDCKNLVQENQNRDIALYCLSVRHSCGFFLHLVDVQNCARANMVSLFKGCYKKHARQHVKDPAGLVCSEAQV